MYVSGQFIQWVEHADILLKLQNMEYTFQLLSLKCGSNYVKSERLA
jgi:hypothetical protein